MKKSEMQEIEDLYESIVDMFDRRCWVCGESYDKKNKKGKRKAFVLHHRFYIVSEKSYEDFRLPNGTHDKLNYLRYLIPIIRQLSIDRANLRFRLMHHTHHYVSEKWARYKPHNLRKMIELALEINQAKYNNNQA